MEGLARKFLQNSHDNNLEGVTDCLSHGVDVNTVSEDGKWSGLTIAAKKNYPELLEILLSHPKIKIQMQPGLGFYFQDSGQLSCLPVVLVTLPLCPCWTSTTRIRDITKKLTKRMTFSIHFLRIMS